jgi:predicted lipoprotein
MTRIPAVALCLAVTLSLAGCKVVKTPVASDDSVSENPISALVDQTFDAKLLPLIAQSATEVSTLRTSVSAGLDAAGKAQGHRGAGEGAAWNFAVKGEGAVVSANLTSRARKADLDTDDDGSADLTLQLGPVIKGTALRDFAPFYDFGDFRDQIEFAELGRAINDKVSAMLILPAGDLVGKRLSFSGVVALKSDSDAWSVTAVTVSVLP